jgi:2-polyprenyl-6-methoxyphenol hydroxylase-like FAD-dependent oxidoreductase
MQKRILISGGGIAGLTAATYLQRRGYEILVVDRAPAFTQAGFLLSLKSFGVDIMAELGLTPALLNAAIPADYMDFVDAQGNLISHNSYQALFENMSRSLLLTRGDLHQVLYDSIKEKANFLFGTTIERVQHEGSTVCVTLSNNQVVEADLLIISEGLRSTTRSKCFEDSHAENFSILYMGGRLNTSHAYQVGSFKTIIAVDTMLSIYPINPQELAVQCYVRHTGEEGKPLSIARHLLQERVTDYSVEVQELLVSFLQSEQLYADKMSLVQAPTLATNGIVLVGDAGYCPTALSGMGASLSIYGAKALTHFLEQSPGDITLAGKKYNALMQPIITKFQDNARRNATSFLPKDKQGLDAFKAAFSNPSESVLQKRLAEQVVLTDNQLQFTVS